MKKGRATLVAAAVLLLVLAIGAQATTWIVESRATASVGQGFGFFTFGGTWADTTGGSTAAGVTIPSIGNKYSTAKVGYWGRWAQYAYVPTVTAYYDVASTWGSSTTNADTVTFTVTHAAGSTVVNKNQNQGGNTWVNLATGVKLNGNTTYTVHQIATTSANGTSSTVSQNQRAQAARWISKTPTVATLTGPANAAIGVGTQVGGTVTANLGWTGGQYNSFFDVFFDTNPNPTTKIGNNLVEGTTVLSVANLLPYTTYYWKVTSKNADASVSTSIRSFTTIPEPASFLALGTGLIGLAAFARRRRA